MNFSNEVNDDDTKFTVPRMLMLLMNKLNETDIIDLNCTRLIFPSPVSKNYTLQHFCTLFNSKNISKCHKTNTDSSLIWK